MADLVSMAPGQDSDAHDDFRRTPLIIKRQAKLVFGPQHGLSFFKREVTSFALAMHVVVVLFRLG